MTAASLKAVVGYLHHGRERDTLRLTDHQLLERGNRDREEAAFAELVRRHGQMVLSTCWRVLRHEQDAEDAFQAVFLILARKAGSIRQQDSLAGWLYRVAHRVALRARAAVGRRREQPVPPENLLATPAPAPPDEPLRGWLDEALQHLPEQYRSALVLCYLEGRTQSEAARLLSTTTNAVNSRLKRARELLRQRLSRRGLALSAGAVAEALVGTARAAPSRPLIQLTARATLAFATNQGTARGVSTLAATLATGALRSMITPKVKFLAVLALTVAVSLAAAGALLLPPIPDDARPRTPTRKSPSRPATAPRPGNKPKPRSVILLWMNGGPSQLDTFDPKPKNINGAFFPAINTNVKGVRISNTLPRLAKAMNHLALIRSLTHREGDHSRATYLMRTGRSVDGGIDGPELGCLLGKELGAGRPHLPRYVSIGRPQWAQGAGYGPGFLGAKYASLQVGRGGRALTLPAAADFDVLEKGQGKKLRKAVAQAFDLKEEKAAVRNAYGRGHFGQGCLLARRLVERGVPVVEVTLWGWDTHANVLGTLPRVTDQLDAAWSMLLKDLHERKRLDRTLVVWMGEFGRTPRINLSGGRDHWPAGFTVVLAGCGIKGGQVIGKTSADGTAIVKRPVTPAELHATIYRALGFDPTKVNRTAKGRKVPLVEKGTRPVKEALR